MLYLTKLEIIEKTEDPNRRDEFYLELLEQILIEEIKHPITREIERKRYRVSRHRHILINIWSELELHDPNLPLPVDLVERIANYRSLDLSNGRDSG